MDRRTNEDGTPLIVAITALYLRRGLKIRSTLIDTDTVYMYTNYMKNINDKQLLIKHLSFAN